MRFSLTRKLSWFDELVHRNIKFIKNAPHRALECANKLNYFCHEAAHPILHTNILKILQSYIIKRNCEDQLPKSLIQKRNCLKMDDRALRYMHFYDHFEISRKRQKQQRKMISNINPSNHNRSTAFKSTVKYATSLNRLKAHTPNLTISSCNGSKHLVSWSGLIMNLHES